MELFIAAIVALVQNFLTKLLTLLLGTG